MKDCTQNYSIIIVSVFILVLSVFIILTMPHGVGAAGGGAATADAQCQPAGRPPRPPDGKDGLPCQTNVAGFPQTCICMNGKCGPMSCSYGGDETNPGGQAGSGALDALKGIVDGIMKAMQQGGQQQQQQPQTASTQPDCSSKNTTDWQFGRCSGSGVSDEILKSTGTNNTTSKILDAFDSNTKDPLPETKVTPVQNPGQGNGNTTTSTAKNGFTSAPEPSSTSQQTNSSSSTTNNEGNVPLNLNGDVSETADTVSVSGSVVDPNTNTGVSGFFGLFNSKSSSGLFERLCTAKPWESSLVTRIFTARFFDSLCERRMQNAQRNTAVLTSGDSTASSIVLRCPSVVQAGGEATIEWSCGENVRSSGIGFNTNGASSGKVSGHPTQTKKYTLECAKGGSRSCTIEVASPRVDLVAYPERVKLGARSKLYWVSEGVTDCALTGPGLSESGPRGAATTGAILDTTTFTIECLGANGATTTDSVVVDVGA